MTKRKVALSLDWPHPVDSQRASAPAVQSLFVDADFQDFRSLMSGQEVSEWLTRLATELQSTFSAQGPDKFDRLDLGRRAHVLIPQAGFLGFSDLSQLCSRLEEACHTKKDLSLPFENARLAAEAAGKQIRSLLFGNE